jgi:hypothetical protein
VFLGVGQVVGMHAEWKEQQAPVEDLLRHSIQGYLAGVDRHMRTLYFHRTEEWDRLGPEQIHVLDSRAPRMITMDPWPQKIYLDATGQLTVDAYIKGVLASYPRGHAPKGLEEFLLAEITRLVDVEGIVALSPQPVELEARLLRPRNSEGRVELAGRWIGSYTYDHRDQVPVPFEISITAVSGERFNGIVKDDETKGGTPGTGTVQGRFTQAELVFVKRMPIRVLGDGQGGRVVDASRQQRPIHYSGNFSHDKRHVAGIWRFKTGILWTRWRPQLYGGSGTWTMEKVD